MWWKENLRVSQTTFDILCRELHMHIERQTTYLRQPISVEKRVAVTLWKFILSSCCISLSRLLSSNSASCFLLFSSHLSCLSSVRSSISAKNKRMSEPLFAPASLPAILLVLVFCDLFTFLEEDGCSPALALALLAVLLTVVTVVLLAVLPAVLVAALLVVLLVALLAGLVVVVGGGGLALLCASSVSVSEPNKFDWGLSGSKSSADGSTTVPSAALSSSVAGVDAARVPRMASISL